MNMEEARKGKKGTYKKIRRYLEGKGETGEETGQRGQGTARQLADIFFNGDVDKWDSFACYLSKYYARRDINFGLYKPSRKEIGIYKIMNAVEEHENMVGNGLSATHKKSVKNLKSTTIAIGNFEELRPLLGEKVAEVLEDYARFIRLNSAKKQSEEAEQNGNTAKASQ